MPSWHGSGAGFAVTRVIFIPQGEFVAFGALTLAMLVDGKVPGTYLLPLLVVALALEVLRAVRTRNAAGLPKAFVACLVLPLALLWLTQSYVAPGTSLWLNMLLLTLALVIPMGPMVYRIVSAAGRSHRAGAADRVGGRALRADRPGPGCSSAPKAGARRRS